VVNGRLGRRYRCDFVRDTKEPPARRIGWSDLNFLYSYGTRSNLGSFEGWERLQTFITAFLRVKSGIAKVNNRPDREAAAPPYKREGRSERRGAIRLHGYLNVESRGSLSVVHCQAKGLHRFLRYLDFSAQGDLLRSPRSFDQKTCFEFERARRTNKGFVFDRAAVGKRTVSQVYQGRAFDEVQSEKESMFRASNVWAGPGNLTSRRATARFTGRIKIRMEDEGMQSLQ